MFRRSTVACFYPGKLPARTRMNANGSRQVPVTVPPPPVGEIGGLCGTSTRYSAELCAVPYATRMARSTYETRMAENRTLYPMSEDRPGELDIRWLPRAFPDPLRNRPLMEVGEPDEIPAQLMVPVIFLCNVMQQPRDLSASVIPNQPRRAANKKAAADGNAAAGEGAAAEADADAEAEGEESEGAGEEKSGDASAAGDAQPNAAADAYDGPGFRVSAELMAEAGVFQARKFETHYVTQDFMRRRLSPQRLAVYATPENYRLLGLPVRDLHIHAEVPKTAAAYQKLRAKQLWDNERWRFSFEMLFRRYDRGPIELLDDAAEEWDGNEETGAAMAGGKDGAAGGGVGRKGPAVNRKAKKIKLF